MRTYRTQILIVGSGPAGLSTAATLMGAGYRCLIVERGVFAQGVAGWPVYMRLFSTTDLVELNGFPLAIPDEKPDRRQYLRYLSRFAAEFKIDVRTHHEVTAAEGNDGAFRVAGAAATGPFEVLCEKIVLATGAYDHPNLLDVPGEDLAHVSHYYREVNDYVGRRTVIAGGRHSAAEAALELARAGIDVTIVHRRENFEHLKYWIAPDLANRIKEGRIKVFTQSTVVEIRPGEIDIEPCGGGRRQTLPADAVLALTGYRPNPDFLINLGLDIEPVTCKPWFDTETFESSRKGIYLTGVMLAGDISGAIFIENSRFHGQRVLAHLDRH